MKYLLKHTTFAFIFAAVALALATFALIPRSAQVTAQDDAPVACDSTLITLLLVAEHDYDYLSGMMDNSDAMAMMPKIEYGQFDQLINDTVAMMMNADDVEMSEDEAMSMDAMNTEVDKLMGMDAAGMLADYAAMSTMTDGGAMGDMVTLAPGNVADENEACTALRADLEKFLLAHIVAESNMMMMENSK